MEIAKIQVTRADARKIYCDTLTSGMVGAKISFSFDNAWDGLNKTAVFKAGQVVKDVPMQSDVVIIPHEVLAKRVPVIHVGIYGTNSDGTLVIPTVWVGIDGIRHGTDPSGDPSTDPTLPVWQQILGMIGDLQGLSTQAKNNLVAAVNEVLTKGGGSVDPDELWRIVEDCLVQNPPTPAGIGALPAPESAEVSQYFRVSAVDENGKVTAVEAVEALEESGGVSVKDYGALGDGATDDTESFVLAIEACPDNGIVYVPAGIYRVSNVALKSNMILEGAGCASVIKLIDNMTTLNQNCVSVNNVSNVIIRNIAMDGNRTNNATPGNSVDGGWNGIHIRDSSHVIVDNVASYSNGYHGCIMVGVSDIVVKNSVFYDNGLRPVHGHDFVDNVTIADNECYANGRGFPAETANYDGVFFFAGITNLTIKGNYIHDCASLGGIIVGGDSFQNTAPSSNINILDNRIDNAETDVNGIFVLGDGITNCVIARNIITAREGVLLTSALTDCVNKDFVISENTIYSCSQFGIRGNTGYSNLIIEGNTIKTVGQFGVFLTDAKKVLINSNNIIDCYFGIDLVTCEGVNIISNIVEQRDGDVLCAMRARDTNTNVKMIYNITDLLVKNDSVDGVTV